MSTNPLVPQPTQQKGMTPGFYAWLVYLVQVINRLAVNAGTGIVTAITGTLPIVIGGSAAIPNVAVNNATSSTVGVVKPDNSTITISGGIISAVGTPSGVTDISGDGVLINNVSSTGSVTLTLGNATKYQFWGRNAGTTGAPAYFNLPTSTFALATDSNGQVISAARLGNTSTIAVTSGSFTVGHFITVDASGNLVDGGAPAGGTVTAVSASYPLASSGGSTPNITLNPLIGFIINSGGTGTNIGPMLTARQAGQVIKCVIVVKASDVSTDLTFKIKKNGTDVFSADPTITHGTTSGTVIISTSLTSVPLSVAANDVFSIDITSGTSSWQITAQLE